MRYTNSIIALGLVLTLGASETSAQTVGGAAQGGELIAAGENALAKGQFQVAARHFAKALRSSDLSDVQVAKALYQRGVANERIERPAQAIADITNALFLPALTGADRAKAYLSRGRAYEAVGMQGLARADISRAKSGGVSQKQIARSNQPVRSGAGGPAFATSSQPAGSRASGPSFDTSIQSEGSRAPAPSFSTRTNAPGSTSSRQRVASFDTQTKASPRQEEPIPRFRTTILPQDGSTKPKPGTGAGSNWNTAAGGQQPEQAQKEESDSAVGRFFGNVWSKATGGGDEKKETAAAPATAPSAPQWNQTTSVARAPQPSWNAQVSSPAPASRPPPPVSTAQPAAAPGGQGYRIQLAALRSDGEAQATWKRLQAKHKNFLGSRQPNIVKTELGGLGTFYRVQLGPFADKAGSQKLCNDFKRGGLDCFLLAP